MHVGTSSHALAFTRLDPLYCQGRLRLLESGSSWGEPDIFACDYPGELSYLERWLSTILIESHDGLHTILSSTEFNYRLLSVELWKTWNSMTIRIFDGSILK